FVKHNYSMPHSLSTVLVEIEGETKILSSNFEHIYIQVDKPDDVEYIELERVEKGAYQSIYYSPHLDLKYNDNFDEIDDYDISLDEFIKRDLDATDKKGTNENGWKFSLHDELLLRNSMRQIEFLNS